MNRHDVRTKREFKGTREALETIRAELKEHDGSTSRTFWVKGVKYIARKTNRSTGHVNLSVTPRIKRYPGRAAEGSLLRRLSND